MRRLMPKLRLAQALLLQEWRLRSRRASSGVLLLAVAILSWLMLYQPDAQSALMVSDHHRIAEDSTALSFAGSQMGSLLLGLVGFFICRGRSQQELNQRTAGVLAASPLSDTNLLMAHWAGGLLFLALLGGVELGVLALHQLLRGDWPFQLGPFLSMGLLGLLPSLVFAASMASLCDAWRPTMGRRGDLLYFVLWAGQFGVLPALLHPQSTASPWWAVLDLSGLGALARRLSELMGTQDLAIGGGVFDPALSTLQIPAGFWTPALIGMRLASMVLALLPLLLAMPLFHRFAPDRVQAPQARDSTWIGRRWQQLMRPVARIPAQGLRLAAALPAAPGQVLAEVCLSLLCRPALLVLWMGLGAAALVLPLSRLPGLAAALCALWGLQVCDLGARDRQAGTTQMAAAVLGGPYRQAWRASAAVLVLGLFWTLPLLLRWSATDPAQAAALLCGLFGLGMLAALSARLTGGGRSFVVLFLFWLYVLIQVPPSPWLDLLAVQGAANLATAAACLSLGLLCYAGQRQLVRRRGVL